MIVARFSLAIHDPTRDELPRDKQLEDEVRGAIAAVYDAVATLNTRGGNCNFRVELIEAPPRTPGPGYYCSACSELIIVPIDAAWPESCPACGAVPLAVQSRNLGVL